jgi:hypothetical protein
MYGVVVVRRLKPSFRDRAALVGGIYLKKAKPPCRSQAVHTPRRSDPLPRLRTRKWRDRHAPLRQPLVLQPRAPHHRDAEAEHQGRRGKRTHDGQETRAVRGINPGPVRACRCPFDTKSCTEGSASCCGFPVDAWPDVDSMRRVNLPTRPNSRSVVSATSRLQRSMARLKIALGCPCAVNVRLPLGPDGAMILSLNTRPTLRARLSLAVD